MRDFAQFSCKNCGNSMSLRDSDIFRVSGATATLYSLFLEGKYWICEATVGGVECAMLNDDILKQCTYCSNPRSYQMIETVGVDVESETTEFDGEKMETKKRKCD